MTYVDGFVAAVPTANRDAYRKFAERAAAIFKEHGALKVVECWGDDVPDGKVTDFRKAVQANDDETVVFSWIEWPDKPTRDAAFAKMKEWMEHPEKADPRMDPSKNPMPFDGKRLIIGGFAPVVEIETRTSS